MYQSNITHVAPLREKNDSFGLERYSQGRNWRNVYVCD